MDGQEIDPWVANVPVNVGRLFRACLCSMARRLNVEGLGLPVAPAPAIAGRALEAMFDHFIDTWWVSMPRAFRMFERDGFRCTVSGCT